jgi:hypothetical protein
LLVVAAAGIRAGLGSSPSGNGRSHDERQPPPPGPSVPLDVAAGRRAGQVVTALARSREGKVAIRQTARLVRAFRAAAQPAPGQVDTEEREPQPGSEPQEGRSSRT